MASARFLPDDPLDDAARLLAAGRANEATALLEGRIGEGRGGLPARLLLVRARLAAGETEGAVAAAREMAILHPSVAEAALALGEALLAAERLPAAIAEFQRALRLDPALETARHGLGCAWLAAGEAEKALPEFTALAPSTPGLAENIAAAQAMRARPRCDAGYVRHLFDQFAADYDARMLSQLGYRAPPILKELADLILPGKTGLAILDLGCGTGLAGAAFKERAGRLDGIDLSPAMIAAARSRGLYDELAVADIESGLGEETYDLVIAADTLVYLGDLAPALAAVFRALKSGGHFLFTVEAKSGEDFELGPKRRWRHSEVYLRTVAGLHGFTVAAFMSCAPRTEAGMKVDGFAVGLGKLHSSKPAER